MRALDILIPILLIIVWLMPLSSLNKIWRLFRGEIKDDDQTMSVCRDAPQAFFSKRVIPTKITAPTNATMMDPIIPPPGQIPNCPKTQPPTIPPKMPRMMSN